MCVLTKDGPTEMRGIGCSGCWGVQGGVWYGRGEMKAPPHGNTYQEDVCAPQLWLVQRVAHT